MPTATDAQFLTNAAEQAAGTGDYAAAEQYLRVVVELQEAGGGTMRADLANTLNNLGVVYERLERPADAEQCYRRAHAIASAALDADHPFVALSAKNLYDFCAARGIPVDPPATPSATADVSDAVGPDFSRAEELQISDAVAPDFSDAVGPDSSRANVAPASRVAKRAPGKLAALVTVVALALIAIVVVTLRSRSTRNPTVAVEPAARPASTPSAAPLAPPRGAEAPPPHVAEAPPPQRRAAPVARVGGAKAPPPQPHPAAPVAPDAPVAPVAPTLVSAALCRTLETRGSWRCAPASGTLAPGTFFFYTRVASPVDATIEHRWYRNDRLHQNVPLRVRANQRNGFRTYSRMTVSAERAGDWRVELRTSGGALLHEERFTVGP